MNRDKLKSELYNYFLQYLNKISDKKSNRLPFSVYFISNNILLTGWSELEIRLAIKDIDTMKYSISIDKGFIINNLTEYSSNSEKWNQELIKVFFHLFNCINDKNEFKTLLSKIYKEYEIFLNHNILEKINNAKKNQSISEQFLIGNNKKPLGYIKTVIEYEDNDSERVGKDTRSDSYTNIRFELIIDDLPKNENEKKWIDILKKYLEENKKYFHSTSYSYSPVQNDTYSSIEIIDLHLTKFINQIYFSNVSIKSFKKLPVENYDNDSLRNMIFRDVENDFKTIKVLLFVIFFNINDLKNIDFAFLDLISILIDHRPNYVNNKDEHIFFTKTFISMNFSKIYNENEDLILSFLISEKSKKIISDTLNNFYINQDSKLNSFSFMRLYNNFKVFYE